VLEYARRLMTGGPWHPPVTPADGTAAAPRPPARRAAARRPETR
jgi:hypothetical protein